MPPRPRPFGQNYQWRVSSDTNYRSRDLNNQDHAALVIAALAQDPDVMSMERVLGERIVMAAIIGVNTLDLRIYSRAQAEVGTGGIVSRNDDNDRALYLEFDSNGGLSAVEGVIKERARSHSPMYYATRVLTPRQVAALDGLQLQISGSKVVPIRPGPRAPLQTEEEMVDVYPPTTPTLEPTPA